MATRRTGLDIKTQTGPVEEIKIASAIRVTNRDETSLPVTERWRRLFLSHSGLLAYFTNDSSKPRGETSDRFVLSLLDAG